MTEETEQSEDELPIEGETVGNSSWEFFDEPPTVARTEELLEQLPDRWGVHVADYIEFVQPLQARKKTKREIEKDGRTLKVDEYVDVWTLYMGVPGRIAMLNEAAEKNSWRVDLSPDPGPGGHAGFVELGEREEGRRIVYREACTIWAMLDNQRGTAYEERLLGTKSGTAWVLAKGGDQAAGSNPFEKVETAARGRAIAGWGLGVLPGSGVASLEEMLNRPDPEAQQQTSSNAKQRSKQPRKSRDEMISEALGLAEECRQLRGEDTSIEERIMQFGASQNIPAGPEGALDWSFWQDGQIALLIGAMEQTRKQLVR